MKKNCIKIISVGGKPKLLECFMINLFRGCQLPVFELSKGFLPKHVWIFEIHCQELLVIHKTQIQTLVKIRPAWRISRSATLLCQIEKSTS